MFSPNLPAEHTGHYYKLNAYTLDYPVLLS